jgi:hypothetical protein
MANYFYYNPRNKTALYSHLNNVVSVVPCQFQELDKKSFFSVYDDNTFFSAIRDVYYDWVYGMKTHHFKVVTVNTIKDLKFVDSLGGYHYKTRWLVLQTPGWTVATRDKDYITKQLETEQVQIMVLDVYGDQL